jgi:AcrR family transcriptional regulator
VANRRRQLLDAAIWVFARKGYRRAAIRDIIDRARVARGTFYLYFDSKEDVFLSVLDDFHAQLQRMVESPDAPVPLAEHNGRAMLQRSLRRWLQLFAEHRDAARIVLKEAIAIDPRFEAGFVRVRQLGAEYFAERFRRFQARGFISRAVPADLLAHIQMGIVDGAVNAYVLTDASIDLEALAGRLAAFEWDGMRPPEGSTIDAPASS